MKTFGSDPELLLTDVDQPISAIGIIKGDIENRININGHQFYYDNVLAECAVKPGSSKEEVIENFRECLGLYAGLVTPYKLKPQASAVFPKHQLENDIARKVGCAIDFCAYEMAQKEGPKEAILNGCLRSCGGHIHLGAKSISEDGAEPILCVYMMDLFIGLPSLFLDKDHTSKRRRELYGQAGRYRVKPYGIEYRSLGNFWLESPDMVGLIYDLSMFCLDYVESGNAWDLWDFDISRFLESNVIADAWQCKAYDPKVLARSINFTDKDAASDMMKMACDMMPDRLRQDLMDMINRNTFKIDFYEEWELNH